MLKEEVINKFNQMYSNSLTLDHIYESQEYNLMSQDKLKVSCNKCHHSWSTSIQNILVFRAGCYECCKGKGYSMDEIKILSYIRDTYIPKEHRSAFRHAERGGQLVVRPKPPRNIPGFIAPYHYQCDGYTHKTYEYNKDKKILNEIEDFRGTVFEVLGDYHHSNPLYYKPNDISPKTGLTHKQNYEYTMNRIKHIEEQGYKVFYIWITDFRRFTRELEKGTIPNLFDYMNIEKVKSDIRSDYSLLTKGTKKIMFNNFCADFNDF